MALRKAHGTAAEHGAIAVVETSPADELPVGVPAEPVRPGVDYDPATGRFLPGNAAAERGGRALAARTRFAARLADQLGLVEVGEELAPYIEPAREYAAAQLAYLAEAVGGGVVGPGPASIVQSAALALAASRYLYAEGSKNGDPKLIVQSAALADKHRMALHSAHELCAREAKARAATGFDPKRLEALLEAGKEPARRKGSDNG